MTGRTTIGRGGLNTGIRILAIAITSFLLATGVLAPVALLYQ